MAGALRAFAAASQTAVVMVTFLSQVFKAEADIVCLCEMATPKTFLAGGGGGGGVHSVI